MEEIIQLLAGILNREFIRAVFSNPRVKDNVVKEKASTDGTEGGAFISVRVFHKDAGIS